MLRKLNPKNPYSYDEIKEVLWLDHNHLTIQVVFPHNKKRTKHFMGTLVSAVTVPLNEGRKEFSRRVTGHGRILYKVMNERPEP